MTTVTALTALAGRSAATPQDSASPGVVGFLAIFVLALATVLLIRSMVGHLRKVRYTQDPAADEGPPGAGDPPGEVGGQVGGQVGGEVRNGPPGRVPGESTERPSRDDA